MSISRSHAVPTTVSIVLPALNERAHIRDCLDSLSGQDHPDVLEILVCDGGSTDGTRQIVADYGGVVRLVDNPGVTAAAGLNIGLDESRGAIVCRGDAHAVYAKDYVRRCVDVLLETGAANVGGPMRAVGTTTFGRAVARVTSSPFGVGPGRFHYASERSKVDTVYLGCWWRTTLEELGGWDDRRLQWGAEDHELNLRISERGGTIILDPAIRSWYYPRESARALARQYRNYGLGKASTLLKHGRLPSWRPLAPASLLLMTVGGAFIGRDGWRVAVPAAHAAMCAATAVRLAVAPGVSPPHAFVATEICHWSYAIGFWQGLARIVRRRSFTYRPAGHR